MDKKTVFYHAVWRLKFGLYLLLDVWCILGDKPILNFQSMRNAHARIISARIRYRRVFNGTLFLIFNFVILNTNAPLMTI